MVLVGPPLDAQQRLTQPGTRGVVRVGGRRNRNLILELKAVAHTIVEIEVRHLIAGVGRIVVRDPAYVYFQVAVARSAGVVCDEWRPSLRMSLRRAQNRDEQNKELKQPAHSNDRSSPLHWNPEEWESSLPRLKPAPSNEG